MSIQNIFCFGEFYKKLSIFCENTGIFQKGRDFGQKFKKMYQKSGLFLKYLFLQIKYIICKCSIWIGGVLTSDFAIKIFKNTWIKMYLPYKSGLSRPALSERKVPRAVMYTKKIRKLHTPSIISSFYITLTYITNHFTLQINYTYFELILCTWFQS